MEDLTKKSNAELLSMIEEVTRKHESKKMEFKKLTEELIEIQKEYAIYNQILRERLNS